jgi:exodeoxyribonuclease VII small subunit
MQEPTFEGSLKRLEEIVSQLEGNALDLDQSLQIFEEGVKLIRFCTSRLDEAERRIEMLLTDKEGRMHAEPFPEESEGAAGEAERP